MITAQTAREAWSLATQHVRTEGLTYTDQDGRQCTEVSDVLLRVNDPSDALALVRELQGEDSWIYPTPDELRSVVLDTHRSHTYAYGARLYGAPNQIDDFLVPLLKASPQTRRAVAVLYDPRTDSQRDAPNVPSWISLQAHIVDGSLCLTMHLRSSDVFVGLPANIFQIRSLQEDIARKIGIRLGSITIFSGSAHYFPEYDAVRGRLMRTGETGRQT